MVDLSQMDPKELERLLKIAAKAEKREEKSREKAEANIRTKHPHLVPYLGTLRQEQHGEGTQTQWCLTFPCSVCGEDMRVFTSDLHQKTSCAGCSKEAKKQAKAALRELLKNPELLTELRKKASVKPEEDDEVSGEVSSEEIEVEEVEAEVEVLTQ